MVFASLLFLYAFLPINIIIYFCCSSIKARNLVLVAFSLFFYAWGEPIWITLLIFSASIDYIHGRVIDATNKPWLKKAMVISSLVLNLGLLFTFKYSGFLVSNVNALLGASFTVPSFALPIGISFYSFQTISYTIDVYRGDVKAQRSFWDFMLFVSLYHQLVAGPIVRYSVVANEIKNRRPDINDISNGITRFIRGLCKKVIIANVAGVFAVKYMGAEISQISTMGAWFGIVMFTIQIYFDFSGYSDMAIGLGWIFGFHYDENFIYPYFAKSVAEFWRKWHISLGTFFRDYVYIPLGGNRKHQTMNILIVWFLTGLWHGASWNFVMWGMYYGILLIIEKKFLLDKLERIPSVFSHAYLMMVTFFGWTIFYFTDLGKLGSYMGALFGFGTKSFSDTALEVTVMNNIFWIVLAAMLSTPILKYISEKFSNSRFNNVMYGLKIPANVVLLFVCTAMLAGQSYNPFLYFRF